MGWLDRHLLSALVFLPLIWAVVGLLVPVRSVGGRNFARIWCLAGSVVSAVIPVALLHGYDPNGAAFQFVENADWIPALGIGYRLGVDGISLCLVALTAFIVPLAVLGSFSAVREKVYEFYFLILFMEFAMFGAFVALDVFLFYVFWEIMLVPMFFIIGVWGGDRRIYAAMKFFIYTLIGSLLMLVAIFYLAYLHKQQFNVYSTSLVDWYRLNIPGTGLLSAQGILFLAFAFAFSIKVPLFPLHTWLPDAHVQAPTAGSVILAAVMLKMGGYGFLRFAMPMFPDAVVQYQVPLMLLGSVAVIYGACVALAQSDIKKLVAYSSVSHMGYVVLGLFSLQQIAVSGAMFQMISHGLATGGLFLIVGMVYERCHTRELSKLGGMAKPMPWMGAAFMVVVLASIALPGTSGFIGEFFVVIGSWKSSPALAILAVTGALLGAIYLLGAYQRMMFGEAKAEDLKDLSAREAAILVPVVIAVIVMGVFPSLITSRYESSITRVFEHSKIPQGGRR